MNKKINKKEDEELQEFLMFRRRGYYVKSKKGKGSYNRNKFKKEEIKNDFFN